MGVLNAGSHETNWDAANINPGVYIFRLTTSSGVYSRKVTIVR
jgi:hypothetical protein